MGVQEPLSGAVAVAVWLLQSHHVLAVVESSGPVQSYISSAEYSTQQRHLISIQSLLRISVNFQGLKNLPWGFLA